MSISRSSIFLEVMENLSKNASISEGDIVSMAKEILHKASNFLKIERANAWLIDDDESKMTCIQAYDRNNDSFYLEDDLLSQSAPIYFNHIRRNKIIISYDARSEEFNKELLERYLIPHKIFSMMEVPILS